MAYWAGIQSLIFTRRPRPVPLFKKKNVDFGMILAMFFLIIGLAVLTLTAENTMLYVLLIRIQSFAQLTLVHNTTYT